MKANRSSANALTALILLALALALPGSIPSASGSASTHLPLSHPAGIPENGALFGLVTDLNGLPALENTLGQRAKVVKIYQAFWHGHFWTDLADRIFAGCQIEFLSYDPVIWENDQERSLNTCEVLSGQYDPVINNFANEVKAWGKPVWISSAGEMNANWDATAWTGDKNFGSNCDKTFATADNLYTYYGCTEAKPECADGPERYRDMYRHIHDTAGLDGNQAAWVWVVNHASFPGSAEQPWNDLTNYYPGDDYVDMIAVDGYNWGYSGPAGWQTFDQIFHSALAQIRANYPNKPVILGEFATAEGQTPDEKANWLKDAYLTQIKTVWPEIRAAIYYNSSAYGDTTFPLNSSDGSISAIQEILRDPYFQARSLQCTYCPGILNIH